MIYEVIYVSTIDDDFCSVWVEASSYADAVELAQENYLDVGTIIDCHPL